VFEGFFQLFGNARKNVSRNRLRSIDDGKYRSGIDLPNGSEENGYQETSYILYKYEYPEVQTLIRYHDTLSEDNKKAREKELKRTYHPNIARRFHRNAQNMFKTVKDSLMEIANMFLGLAKKGMRGGAILTSQGKHVARMKQELAESVGTSYEPLLERYIGQSSYPASPQGGSHLRIRRCAKRLYRRFVEVMDLNYSGEDQPVKKGDLVVPRKHGIIRHLAE